MERAKAPSELVAKEATFSKGLPEQGEVHSSYKHRLIALQNPHGSYENITPTRNRSSLCARYIRLQDQ